MDGETPEHHKKKHSKDVQDLWEEIEQREKNLSEEIDSAEESLDDSEESREEE